MGMTGPDPSPEVLGQRERKTLLVTVKAYPVVDAASRSEAVCVAGITEDEPRNWIRLFPLDFRGLPFSRQFRKYQLITVELTRARNDPRPESYTPALDSIALGAFIESDRGTWRRRLDYVEPLMSDSMCAIQRAQRESGRSLGAFMPQEVDALDVRPSSTEWSPGQAGVIDQASFFDEKRERLEPLPIKARYRYRCKDRSCPGHEQSIVDWELGQLYRNLREKDESDAGCREKVRAKFLDDLTGPNVETIFLTGNMAKHQASFLILGVLYPKRQPQGSLVS